MKVFSVIGARPQIVKAAAVSRVFKRLEHDEILVHTGQHYDQNMSGVFFDEMEIAPPDRNLGIGSGSHGEQTGRMLQALESAMLEEKPDVVLVYGDTNSTLAGALAAAKLDIPIGHVEAGLRSFNRSMPEEVNRIVADHCSFLLFAPTQTAVNNLLAEGFGEDKVHLVGDVMYDTTLFYAEKAEALSTVLDRYDLSKSEYILATIHRAENTDDSDLLTRLFDEFIQVSTRYTVIMPLHPRTRAAMERAGITERVAAHLQLVEPAGYLDMLMLEKNARAIITDSGGVQKESFFFRVPCLITRKETEWLELLKSGWSRLYSPVGGRPMLESLEELEISQPDSGHSELFGTGKSSEHIVDVIAERFA